MSTSISWYGVCMNEEELLDRLELLECERNEALLEAAKYMGLYDQWYSESVSQYAKITQLITQVQDLMKEVAHLEMKLEQIPYVTQSRNWTLNPTIPSEYSTGMFQLREPTRIPTEMDYNDQPLI